MNKRSQDQAKRISEIPADQRSPREQASYDNYAAQLEAEKREAKRLHDWDQATR